MIREVFGETVNSCNSRRLKRMTEIDHEINNVILDPDTFFFFFFNPKLDVIRITIEIELRK